MDHLHYNKFENDCFGIIIVGALTNMTQLWAMIFKDKQSDDDDENLYNRIGDYIFFPIGTVLLRCILCGCYFYISSY